jgi:hypothetical protein
MNISPASQATLYPKALSAQPAPVARNKEVVAASRAQAAASASPAADARRFDIMA